MASINTLQGNLGHKRAAHLLRRATYRYTKAKVDALAGMSAAQAVASLLAYQPLQMDQPVFDGATSNGNQDNYTWILPPGQTQLALPSDGTKRRYVMAWWINEALYDEGIAHKMTFFFHQYMVVDAISYQNTHFFDYLSLMRWGALRNFKKLATKLVMDNCMIRYLNNQQNTKNNPNENFAREFFELFTIGKGPQIGPGDYTNYTEDDIVQAARVFTGFRIRGQRDTLDPETGIPRGVITVSLHDTGNKTFSEKFQNTTIQGGNNTATITQELLDFVDMVFAQEEVARLFCRRLYRFFISRNITPEIESDIIGPLAQTFRTNNYEVVPVLQQLLSSEHFYDADDATSGDEIIGGLIKNPMEILLQSMSFFSLEPPHPIQATADHYNRFWGQAVIDRAFMIGGLPIFMPNDVAGYPGYHQAPDYQHQWFNSSTIIARYKVPAMLLSGRRSIGSSSTGTTGVQLKIAEWLRDSNFCNDPSDPYVVVQDLIEYLLPQDIDSDRFNYFYQTVFLDNLPPADWTYEWQNYLDSGNDTEVKIALERLVNAILYSQEFQTM